MFLNLQPPSVIARRIAPKGEATLSVYALQSEIERIQRETIQAVADCIDLAAELRSEAGRMYRHATRDHLPAMTVAERINAHLDALLWASELADLPYPEFESLLKRRLIEEALKKSGYVVNRAAKKLQMRRDNLASRIKTLRIAIPPGKDKRGGRRAKIA
jgi:transcriptional regulator with GAF, ATPase, and Fis domain